jgi:5-methylcytosine-specific restriction endonuclease McrA
MCASCLVKRKEYGRRQRRTTGRFCCAKIYARQKQQEWGLLETEYLEKISKPCTYCGFQNDVVAGIGLDRIDNQKGYIIDNVVSCCTDCNLVRGRRYTMGEMQVIGKAIAEVKKRRVVLTNRCI